MVNTPQVCNLSARADTQQITDQKSQDLLPKKRKKCDFGPPVSKHEKTSSTCSDPLCLYVIYSVHMNTLRQQTVFVL